MKPRSLGRSDMDLSAWVCLSVIMRTSWFGGACSVMAVANFRMHFVQGQVDFGIEEWAISRPRIFFIPRATPDPAKTVSFSKRCPQRTKK